MHSKSESPEAHFCHWDFIERDQRILSTQRSTRVKNIAKKKCRNNGFILPDIRTFYKIASVTIVWCLHKVRSTNGTTLSVLTQTYIGVITWFITKKTLHCGWEGAVFSVSGTGLISILMGKTMHHYSPHYMKNNFRPCYTKWSKWKKNKYCILTHIYGI